MEEVAFASAKWLWKEYGKDLVGKAFAFFTQKWKIFQWEEAEASYRKNLRAQYSTTRILGYPKPINVEGIFTDVYVLGMLSSKQRLDLLDLQSKPYEREETSINQRRIPVMEVLKDKKRLLILGKPGAGKTTLLKYLTLQACAGKVITTKEIKKETKRREIKKEYRSYIATPIFVSLREWSESKLSLIDYIVKQFDICAFPDADAFIEHMLKDGFALVLFDGLDEVKSDDDQRAHIISSLNEFAERYRDIQICITCRVAATDYTFEQFSYVEVADFDKKQIRTFIDKWYQQDQAKHDEFLKEFYKSEHLDLRELARTPLLLALLCLAFDETLNFPVRKVELFKEAIDALLRKWDASRGIRRDNIYHNLSPIRKEQLLSCLATKNFIAGNYFINEDVLARQVQEFLEQLPSAEQTGMPTGNAVVKAIESQHGILIERASGIYSFSHLTFQEYFTARYIVDNLSLGTLEDLCRNCLLDTKWHEVINLVVSLLQNADAFYKMALPIMHNLINKDQSFIKLLRWARDKASLSNYPKILARAIFLFVALDIIDVRLLKEGRYEQDFYSAVNETYNFALELARLIFPKRITGQSTTVRIARTMSYKRAIDISKTLGVALSKDQIEDELSFLTLTPLTNLLVYLKVNRLLVETLKLASVSKRELIEDEVLAPPPTVSKLSSNSQIETSLLGQVKHNM